MSLTYRESKIISNEKVIDNIYKMVCTDTNEVKPGQFYMLKKEGSTTLLPRPISVCEKEDGTVTFMYAVVGKGTEEFSKMKAGEEISLTGPLGNGFNLENLGKTAIVAGGIGTAPMVEVAKRLREKNKDAVIDV